MCYELRPKVIFGIIADITSFFTSILWLEPFFNGDRDVVPNNHSTLIYKHPRVREGTSRSSKYRIYFLDGEPLISLQLFGRASWPRLLLRFLGLLRSGGLKEERVVINIDIHISINGSSHNRLINIYIPRRLLSMDHHL